MRNVELSTADILLAADALNQVRRLDGVACNHDKLQRLDRLFRLFERAENVTLSVNNTHTTANVSNHISPAK